MVVCKLSCCHCGSEFFNKNTTKLSQVHEAYERGQQHEETCPRRKRSPVKPRFVCEFCKPLVNSFKHKYQLARHQANTHDTVEKECPICSESVKVGYNDEYFKRHLKEHEKTPSPPPVRGSIARHTHAQKLAIIRKADQLEGPARETYLRRSNVSDRKLDEWKANHENPAKRRMLTKASRSAGAGKRPLEKKVINTEMDAELRKLLYVTRGPPPEGHALHSKEYLVDSGHRTAVTYDDLVEHLYADPRFDKIFKDQENNSSRKNFEVTRELVYKRVQRWCKDNDVVIKTASAAPKNEKLIAQRCLGTLQKIQEVQTQKGPATVTYCNLDETALRVLALSLKTLCYKGGKCTLDREQLSKFTLSLVCLWYSQSGEVDFYVMCGGGTQKVEWSHHSGTWFLTTTSKMMRKDSYSDLLNFALSKEVFDAFLDDLAGGHHGSNPDNVLKQLNPAAIRIRIQGGTTSHIQAADSVWCNFQLKRILTDIMRKNRIKELLEKGKIEYLMSNKLTKKGKDFVGELLSDLKRTWNSDKKLTNGVKLAFQKLYAPTEASPHPKKLQKLLKKAEGLPPVYEPYASKDDRRHGECKYLCGHVFSSKKDNQKHEKEPKNCWPRRPNLQPPPFRNQVTPGTVPIGMLFRMNGDLGVIVKSILEFKPSSSCSHLVIAIEGCPKIIKPFPNCFHLVTESKTGLKPKLKHLKNALQVTTQHLGSLLSLKLSNLASGNSKR